MKNKITNTETGFLAEVGDASLLFPFADYGNSDLCQNAAIKWARKQTEFQKPSRSLGDCVLSATRLKELVSKLKDPFPRGGHFFIDETNQCLGVSFNSIVVFESDSGYNAELIVNWKSHKRIVICTGMSLDSMVEMIQRAEPNMMYPTYSPRTLHLSDFNREMLLNLCEIEN